MQLLSVVFPIIFLSTVFEKVNSAATGCGSEVLVNCAKSLNVISNNQEFGFAVKKEELDKICPDLNEGLRCIDEYTRRCMAPPQRAHFNKLYAGSSMVIQEICQPGPYQDEFLRHAPCMREVRADYEECARDYQNKIGTLMGNDSVVNSRNNEENEKRLCCSFQEYLQCSNAIVKDTCGEETAEFTKSFLDRMSHSLIQVHCTRYSPDTDSCEETPSSSPALLVNTLLVLSSIVLLRWT